LAGRFRLPSLPRDLKLDDQAQSAGLRWLRIPGVAHGGYDLPRYAETTGLVVSGLLVGDGAKAWSQCPGLQRILGLGSYLGAWTWLHKLRRAMVRPDRHRLSVASA